ncbi:MAG: hypothetical protein ACYS47_10310 [Planctomycetota bacterium]|jgi:hypothetical protein
MKARIAIVAVFALLCSTALAGEKKKKSALDKLKDILKKMETVEKLLAKSDLDDAEKKQSDIIKELRKKVEAGKLKEDEVIDEIDKQLKVVIKKMKDIDKDIVKLIQEVKLMQGQGSGGGMEWKQKPGEKSEQQKRKEREERELKKLRKEKEGKNPKASKGKEQQKHKPGENPAERAYDARGPGPKGAPRRAGGTGRWGSLPLKEFKEALASGRVKVPEKYRALIEKYLTMLAKEGKEKKD